MGYPMTWKRLINRNGLADGDYGKPPERWKLFVNDKPVIRYGWNEGVDLADVMQTIIDRMNTDMTTKNNGAAIFAGDLRRLEKDTLDENVVCQTISTNTGVSMNDVAAVLKEWMKI